MHESNARTRIRELRGQQIVTSPAISNIVRVDGDTIEIKERGGAPAKVHLASNAKIASVAKATLSDIKPGAFIGTAATPRTDGTLQAIEVHIFPESMRGTGEGTRVWDLAPKSSMTNGTVAPKPNKVENNQVNEVEGNDLIVDYNGGTKVVAVTVDTKVVTLVPGDRAELKPNVEIFIAGATRDPRRHIGGKPCHRRQGRHPAAYVIKSMSATRATGCTRVQPSRLGTPADPASAVTNGHIIAASRNRLYAVSLPATQLTPPRRVDPDRARP